MKIDFSSLQKALASLDKAITRSRDLPDDEEIRDAVIQRFEYSYELSWKMLKRKLEHEVPNPAEVDRWSYRELMREGAERGYIADPVSWFVYREQRNLTSHTYDQKKAQSVYRSAVAFYSDAIGLLGALMNSTNE